MTKPRKLPKGNEKTIVLNSFKLLELLELLELPKYKN